jgi:hypothetical protein
MATGYGLDSRGSIPIWDKRFFSLHSLKTRSEAHPDSSIQWVPRALSAEAKRPGCEADHSHLVPRSRMVKLYHHSPIRIHSVLFYLYCRKTESSNFLMTSQQSTSLSGNDETSKICPTKNTLGLPTNHHSIGPSYTYIITAPEICDSSHQPEVLWTSGLDKVRNLFRIVSYYGVSFSLPQEMFWHLSVKGKVKLSLCLTN